MKIGVLVGKTESGKLEYIGEAGDIPKLKARIIKISQAGGIVKAGKGEKKYVEMWLADVNRHPIKKRRC
jgi:hypothetical protein